MLTEQSPATLCRKTARQHIDELTSIAHPDLRAELRREAARRYHV